MNLFHRIGRASARHRRLVFAAWLVAVAVAVPLAPQASGVLRAGGFSAPDLESARARAVLEAELGLPQSVLVVIARGETSARAGDPAFEEAVARSLADVPKVPHVKGIQSHARSPRQVSADRRTVYEIVTLDLEPDRSPEVMPGIEAALHPQPGITLMLAGAPAFYGDIQAVSEADLQRSELISIPLAAVALLVVFGSVVAAGVPLIVGGASALIALAVVFLVGSVTPMSIFVLNLATLMGLGLGVDYSLLVASRFREELALRGGGRRPDGSVDQAIVDEAVAVTTGTAGRAIFFSALSVLLGVVGLLLFDFMILRSIGIAGGVVMVLGMAAALTLLPAVLSFMGPRIDALSLRRTSPLPEAEGPWARFARRVMERPWQVLLPTLALLLLLGWPFLHARVNAPDATILPPDVPSRQAYDLLVREFGEGDFAPLLLAIRTDGPVTSVDNVGRLYDWSRRLAADPRVNGVDGIVDIDPRLTRLQYQLLLGSPAGIPDRFTATFVGAAAKGDLTAFLVTTPYGPNHDAARALVMELRDPGSPLAPPEGMELLVAGGAAEVADVVDRIRDQFPRSALIIVLATYGVLFVLLRSVVLPLKALAMNTLSILASFGALVWIFQDGNLSAVLGFQPLGFVETTAPVILFCVLFGLSMDYEVFLLARMKEVWDRTGDNREAVARGLERSGRIVTSAALIVFVVAGSFAAAEIVLIKALGVGVAIAVALDATVIRALLVPATMRLLGDRNWWLPGPVRRFLDRRLPLVETVALVLVVALVAGCGPDGRVLAVPPTEPPPTPPALASATPPADPLPLAFPADDGPHGRLTEWWYYTGHLRSGDGRRFGFEYVVFRAERGDFPVAWASHLALTDESAGTFRYDQRNEIGPQADRSRPGAGFDLAVLARDDAGVPVPGATTWTMRGGDGRDQLAAESVTGGFGLSLALDDGARPPVLHDADGFVDFGPGGTSYYYSRTRMAARGSLSLDGLELRVEGMAWFDHQWGDFITVGGTGWDWFAVNLEDGTDVTLSLVRGLDDRVVIAYGTLVRPDGRAVHLAADDFTVQTLGRWQSPNTGADYPSGWLVRLPGEELAIELRPTVADQELDTRATTGVVYWEGSQRVRATRAGRVQSGEAYVELTGYAGGLPGDGAP